MGSMLTASTSHLPHPFRRAAHSPEEESRCGPRGCRESSIRPGFPVRNLPRRWPRIRRTMGLSSKPKLRRFPRSPSRSFDPPPPSPESSHAVDE